MTGRLQDWNLQALHVAPALAFELERDTEKDRESRRSSDMALCPPPGNLYHFQNALRAFFAVLGTHVLAGEVDTTLANDNLMVRLSWLLRYFNPVNLCWRYYSILAYRAMAETWADKQLALINYEGHPYKPPIPYLVGERMEDYRVKRVEISGMQVLFSFSSAYQGILAVRYAAVATAGVGFLPNITKPLALLGLFRVIASRWIASKVYVKPYAYPAPAHLDWVRINGTYKSYKFAACSWLVVLGGLVFLSFWPYIGYSPSSIQQKHYLDVCIQSLYQYEVLSMSFCHVLLLLQGPRALSNRILYFDHWCYLLQTCGFFVFLAGTTVFGIVDFVHHDYYKYCEF